MHVSALLLVFGTLSLCGRSAGEENVTTGTDATGTVSSSALLSEFPYICSVHNQKKQFLSTCVVIHKKWILTTVPGNKWDMGFVMYNRNSTNSTSPKMKEIRTAYVHPMGYPSKEDPNRRPRNNLLLLKTDTKMKLSVDPMEGGWYLELKKLNPLNYCDKNATIFFFEPEQPMMQKRVVKLTRKEIQDDKIEAMHKVYAGTGFHGLGAPVMVDDMLLGLTINSNTSTHVQTLYNYVNAIRNTVDHR